MSLWQYVHRRILTEERRLIGSMTHHSDGSRPGCGLQLLLKVETANCYRVLDTWNSLPLTA